MSFYVFGPRKDKAYRYVLVFCKGISNAICDLVLCLLNEGLNISLIYDGTMLFQYLKTADAMQDSSFSKIVKQSNFQKFVVPI